MEQCSRPIVMPYIRKSSSWLNWHPLQPELQVFPPPHTDPGISMQCLMREAAARWLQSQIGVPQSSLFAVSPLHNQSEEAGRLQCLRPDLQMMTFALKLLYKGLCNQMQPIRLI